MRLSGSLYRRTVAMLLCCLLLGALAPGATWLVAPRDASPWQEICGVGAGKVAVAAVADPAARGTPAVLTSAHPCLFCLPQHDLPALPSAPMLVVLGLLADTPPHAVFEPPLPPAPRFAWSVTLARAPPA